MNKFRTKQLGNYSIGKKLGSGKFSSVHLARDINSDNLFAAKIIKKESILSEDDWHRIKREIEVLTRLDHPNIINMIEVFQTESTMCIITDYVEGGDLYDYITNQSPKRIKPEEAFSFFRQMIAAMGYCHSKFVIHRDLKPENILLTKQKKIKIADFGFARTFSPGNPMNTPCGSFQYAAPEVIAGKRYLGASSDVWSLGCILYVMLVGALPFKGNNNVDTLMRIKEGRFIDSEYLINNETRKFLKSILHPNPSSRLTLREIANHHVIWQGKTLLAMLIRPFAQIVKKKYKEDTNERQIKRSFSDSDLRSSKYARKHIPKTKEKIQAKETKKEPIEDNIQPILLKSNSQILNVNDIIQLD